MTRPWVRLVLVFAGLAAIAGAGIVIWSSESRARAASASLRLAEDAGRRAMSDAADLRAAQQGYVAVGQGEEFWFARVSALTKDLDEVLTVFKTHLASPEALAAVDDATGAIQDFSQIDARARELTHGHDLAQASDVIFGDGFEVAQKITGALTRAASVEASAHDASAAALRRRETVALAAGAGVTALVLLLLIPGGARPVEEAPVSLSSVLAGPVSKDTLDDLNDFGLVARPAAAAAAAVPNPVDLAAIASVCADLARVTDTLAIPLLLERAATILDAAGIVLWIADPDGRELTPIVVHGYPPQIATRLSAIGRDAANVTAAAYRTGLLQTVKSDAVSNGAIAAPLVASTGCLGVMAIEMKDGGEQREPLLAAATIIASQLSTLVGPPSSRARAEATG